jgi:hypothetical protein
MKSYLFWTTGLTAILVNSGNLFISAWFNPSIPHRIGGIKPISCLQASTVTPNSSGGSSRSASEDDVDTDVILDSLKNLLEHLDGPDGGKTLLESSSPSWRHAICQALGAPDTANEELVADALQQAMARPKNQFAILMGTADQDFEAVFPTEPVIDDDHAIWVECQLRQSESDKLLVDLGVSLRKDDADGRWKIDDLQWQDFRDEFYPGLSGREWLRAF